MELDRQEEEANLFARLLLVPDKLLRKSLKGRKPKPSWLFDDEFVKKLATQYKVPITLMCVRLREFAEAQKNGCTE